MRLQTFHSAVLRGGVACDPKKLSRRDIQHITRRFVADLGNDIGPHIDIPAPDVGTNAETMAIVYDTYDMMHRGTNNLGVVTGKPVHIGGSYGREEATGRGGLFVAQRALEKGVLADPNDLKGLTVAIQGFGNVGSNAARLFHETGARIVAVSDSFGGVYQKSGLSPMAVMDHKRRTGSVVGLEGVDNVSSDELLTVPCDILVPAALENQLREDNAGDVQARMIVELANGPTTARGTPDPPRAGDPDHSRYPCELGRRVRQLLRMGAERPERAVGRQRSKRQARARHEAGD